MPDDPEASIANGLALRHIEPEMRRFWPREAIGFPRAPTEEQMRELDGAWCELMRDAVRAVLKDAPVQTQRVLASISSMPSGRRETAFAEERSALIGFETMRREDEAFVEEMLAHGLDLHLAALSRFHARELAGENLKMRWQAWLRTSEGRQVAAVPRELGLEAAIARYPESSEFTLAYASWLRTQNGGNSLGRFMQLAVENPKSWRADLLLRYDPGVLGTLSGIGRLEWRDGLVREAWTHAQQLNAFFAHPATCALQRLHIDGVPDTATPFEFQAPALREVWLELPRRRKKRPPAKVEWLLVELLNRTGVRVIHADRVVLAEVGPLPRAVELVSEDFRE